MSSSTSAYSDDVDREPSASDKLWQQICCGIGSRSFLVQQVKTHLLAAAGGIALTSVSFIVDAACGGVKSIRCNIVGAAAGHWLRLCAFALVISPMTVLFDRLLFAFIAQIGAAFTRRAKRPTPTVAALLFYAAAFEESAGRVLWLVLVISFEEVAQIVDGVKAEATDRVLLTMLLWVAVIIIRTVFVRVASRSLLLASFDSKVSNTIFAATVVLGLTLHQERSAAASPKESVCTFAPAGRGHAEGDTIFSSLAELAASTDAARKFDAASSLRLIAWDAGSIRTGVPAKLVTVVKASELPRLARKAFRALAMIPQSQLPTVVKVSTEEMLLHRRVLAGERARAISAGTAAAVAATFTARGGGNSSGGVGFNAITTGGGKSGGTSGSGGGGGQYSHLEEEKSSISPPTTSVKPSPSLRAQNTSQQSPRLRPSLNLSTFAPPQDTLPTPPHSVLASTTNSSITVVTVQDGESTSSSKPTTLPSGRLRSSSAPRVRTMSSGGNGGGDGVGRGGEAASAGFTGLDVWPDDIDTINTTTTSTTMSSTTSIGRSTSVGARLWRHDSAANNHRTIGKLISNELRSAVREIMAGDTPTYDTGNNGTDTTTNATDVAASAPTAIAQSSSVATDRIFLHKLHLAHFAACLGIEDSTVYERAFALCDLDGDGKCTLDEFVGFFERVFDELVALKASLNGSESSVSALAFLANALGFIAILVSTFVIFEVSLTAVVLPLSTLFLSLSFAVGPSIANVVGSLIFVFERRFDVGDRVTAKGVGATEGEILTVQRIDVLTTSFLTFTNRLVMVPNWVLAASVIENLKRSPTANVCLALAVSTQTTSRQLEALQSRLRNFTEAESSSFKPGVFFRIRGIENGNLLLSVWASSHFTYGQAPECYRGIFSLWLATLEALRAEGIACRLADQSIELRTAVGGMGGGGGVTGSGGAEGLAELSKLIASTGGKVATLA